MLNPYPWQQKTWQFLISGVREARLAQALLLHGISGLGKRDFAMAFSAHVLCDGKLDRDKACQQCQSCQWFKAGSHPDFFHISLKEKSKSIKIDQLRALRNSLEQTSQRGGYQIALIESADTMNHAAANALLKTLEEPPGKVVILLVANCLDPLPATIISRCQRIAFCASPNKVAVSWLQQQLSGDKKIDLLLKVADYAPLRALEYAQSNYFEFRDQLLRHLLRIQKGEVHPIALTVSFLDQPLSFLLIVLMSIISDVVRLQHGVQYDALLHLDRLAQLQSLAQLHDVVRLHEYFQLCQKALAAEHSGIHINPQLLLENLLIDYYWCCIANKETHVY